MKRIVALIMVAMLAVFVSCGKEKEFTGVPEDARYVEMYQTTTFSPEGVFFTKNDWLWFRPEGENEAVVLCYDPNCIHEPASDINPDPTCRAALFADSRTYAAYYEGNIYYFTSDNLFTHKIYKMEIDGPGRSFVAEIPYSCEIPGGMVFCGDKIYYYVLEKTRVGEMGELDKKSYILEFDLKSGDYRFVTPPLTYGALGDAMQITKDYLYLLQYDQSNGGLLFVNRYNLETAEEEVFISTEEHKTHKLVRAYDDYYVFYNSYLESGDGAELGIKDLKTGEETIILELEGNDYFFNIDASGNYILYSVRELVEDSEHIKKGTYFYNMLTGETIDITEKAEEYNIKDYDAYNSVFICNVVLDTSVVSEEKILGN